MKKCKECNTPLISFKGHYLHPEELCSGLDDGIRIDMEIVDEGLNQKWIEEVGKPEKDDYEMRIQIEQELEELKKGMKQRQDRINQLMNNLKVIEVNKNGWKKQAKESEEELGELKIEHLRLEATIEGNWLLRNLVKIINKKNE